MKNLTFKIEEDLHRRFKIASVNEGKTMAQILNMIVENYVKRTEKKLEAKKGD